MWGLGRSRLIAIVFAISVTTTILLAMGRPPICTCGTIKLWEGAVNSAGNSQHLSDWYSFSHMIHGMVFYMLLTITLGPRLAVGDRLLVAVVLESAWEILENSPIIIERYRTATIALGYTGDSLLNSVSDIIMMMVGFGIARNAPKGVTIALAMLFECFPLWAIRDNLTLNVLMLVWPVDAIRQWQTLA